MEECFTLLTVILMRQSLLEAKKCETDTRMFPIVDSDSYAPKLTVV